MAFGVGGCEFAVPIARASNEPAAQMGLTPIETRFDEGFLHRLDVTVRDVRQDEVLPDSEANLSGTVKVGDFGEAKELFRSDLADRHGYTDVLQAALFLR